VERIKQSSASVPVITMRSGAMGIPLVKRTSSHPRIKINIPLNKRGVEMRMPAIPMIKPSWRILSGALVILLGALIIFLNTSNQFIVKAPQIKGLTRLSDTDLQAALALNNQSIFMIDPQQIESTLMTAFPDIKQVSVDVSFPAKVTIQGVERTPVVTWKYQDMIMWIDNEGVLFPSHGDADTVLTITSVGVPPMVQSLLKPDLLSDATTNTQTNGSDQKKDSVQTSQRFVDRNVLNSAILLYQQLPANTTVLYDQTRGLGWVDNGGWSVYVGFDLDQIEQKMLVYQKLIEKLNQEGIHPKLVSIEYLNAPYYRLE
jgi:cell division protein FtsQ